MKVYPYPRLVKATNLEAWRGYIWVVEFGYSDLQSNRFREIVEELGRIKIDCRISDSICRYIGFPTEDLAAFYFLKAQT